MENDNNFGLGQDIASPQDYLSIINGAYKNLGQPENDNGRMELTQNFVRGLSSSFVDRYHKATGQIPTTDQVKQFVAQNANNSTAMRFAQGQLTPDQINIMSDQHIQDNPGTGTSGSLQDRIMALNDQLDKIYQTGKENYVKSYDQNVYAPAKEGAVNDLAGQGMLTQPNSRFSLDKIESNRGRDISSGLNTLESNRATGAIDLGKTIENLLQGQQQIQNQNSQFNKGLSFQQNNADMQNMYNEKQLSLADRLGRLQAEASKPGWDDKVLAGLSGARSAASTGASIYSAGKAQ